MKEPVTIEGRWWIFGNDKPEHFGVLQYTPEKGLNLSVKIARSIGVQEILTPITESIGTANTTTRQDVIQGRDENDHPITLFGCASPNVSRSGGLESYEFYPMIALIGQMVESWKSTVFQRVNLRFSLLHNWISQSLIEQKFTPEHVPQIQIKPKSAIEVKLANEITVKINSEFRTDPRSGSFEITEGHFISIEFPQPIHVKSILTDYAEILRRLFSLLIGTEVILESVMFEVPNSGTWPSHAEFFQRNEAIVRAKRYVSASRMTAPHQEIADIFPTVLSKWFEYHKRLEAVLNLYFAVFFNPPLYVNHQFLFLAQALEVYHNSNAAFVGCVQPTAEFRARRNQIVSAVLPEDREWLAEKLHYANQKTLAQRISDILLKNKAEAEQFITDLPRFADSVKNTRNYHTHFDEELKEKGKVTDDIEEMVRLVSQMQTLLGICILKDIGITGKPIARLIERHRKMEIYSVK